MIVFPNIQDAIVWIGRHIEGMTKNAFLADRKSQDSVIKNLIDIGEASNNVMQLYLPDFERAIASARTE